MLVFLLLAVCICPPAGASQAPMLVDYLIIHHPSISPNGDGVQDFSLIFIGLLEQCDTLSATVEDPNRGDTLNTLLFLRGPLPGDYNAVWNGEDSLGALLPEGTYLFHLMAVHTDTTEHHYRALVVDITTPEVVLERIEPGLFAPGAPGMPDSVTVYFSVFDFEENDVLGITVTDPEGTVETVPHRVTGNGSYKIKWSTVEDAPDGFYRVRLHAFDEAGNSSEANGQIYVDNRGPDIGFLDSIPEFTSEIPKEITGYCFDQSGIDGEPAFAWNNGEPFSADTTFMRSDTLFWGLDSLTIYDNVTDDIGSIKEIKHSVKVTCADIFGHQSSAVLSFTLDLTPPDPPVLTVSSDLVYEPEVGVQGEVTEHTRLEEVLIYRVHDGDTLIFTEEIIASTFQLIVEPLGLGDNFIYGVSVDKSGMRSERSRGWQVVFRQLNAYYPEVFTGSAGTDFFEFRLSENAQKVDIQIYTVNGEHVRSLNEQGPKRLFKLEWDLTNDEGDGVRNGPYLVYISIYYSNTTTTQKSFIAVVRE